jgi:hypothetical protein
MGIFGKKEKRAMEVMQERNKRYLESVSENEPVDDRQEEVYPEGTFEKGDIPAIIISALIVFFPIFLIMGIIIVLAYRVLLSA